MTGIEQLRKMGADAVRGGEVGRAISDIADQIERETEEQSARLYDERVGEETGVCELFGVEPVDDPLTSLRRHVEGLNDTVENLRLELGEARDEAAWVREHGGLESVKERLDWVVGHCSTKQQLDFDFWLSGRVMYELGFDEDMADRDEVERRLLARIMPEGMEWLVEAWPRFDDDAPVRGGDEVCGGGRAFIVDHVVLFSNGESTVCAEADMDSGKVRDYVRVRPSYRLKRPESWERLEEDAEKDPCNYFGFDGEETCGKCPASGKNCEQTMARDIVRRARALAERSE